MTMSMGFGDLSSYSITLGFGLKKRVVINDFLLVQGKIGPYIGYWGYEVEEFDKLDRNGNPKYEKKNKWEITYGANASVSVGIKLWDTKKGNTTFLTVGYYISAPEFETKNMIDNGSWGLGFTTILK